MTLATSEMENADLLCAQEEDETGEYIIALPQLCSPCFTDDTEKFLLNQSHKTAW